MLVCFASGLQQPTAWSDELIAGGRRLTAWGMAAVAAVAPVCMAAPPAPPALVRPPPRRGAPGGHGKETYTYVCVDACESMIQLSAGRLMCETWGKTDRKLDEWVHARMLKSYICVLMYAQT